MEHSVTTEKSRIIFGATGLESILQNVRTIVTTIKGTVPLDRGFGIDSEDVDMPIEIVKARLTAKIIDAIEEYEPRAEVTGVEYSQDDLVGILSPIVKIRPKEGDEF